MGPAFTFLLAVSALGIFDIITPSEILSGFANEQIVVIIMLLLLGDIIRKESIIEIIFDKIFKSAKSYKGFMAQMMILVGGFSAFLNNTPLVAVMMPYVHSWSKKNKISSSRLLIPLSFAAILGGAVTLIGTSTNLIVNGLVIDQEIIPDFPSLDMFDFTLVGLPMFVIGFLYMLFIGDKLLPNNPENTEEIALNSREYIVEVQIRKNSHLVGKTIADGNLRNLNGLYLVEIVRDNFKLQAVTPDAVLLEGDILFFAGDTANIADLMSPESGLTFPDLGMYKKRPYTEIIEVVISHNSPLMNTNVKEVNFRSKYDCAVIAIHRNGEKIKGKIGKIKLKAGDVLLLIAGSDFLKKTNDLTDFYFISKVKEIKRKENYKIIILIGGTALAIALSAFKIVSLFLALIVLFILILFFKIASPKDIHKNIDYNLAIIIALSLALGTAMMKTGVADMIADLLINLFLPLGNMGMLFGIYFITAVLAAYITNKAAVAIIFPISLTMALHLNADPMPFILVVSFAAAANFMTPIGYQTNLMVYGPGGYKFKDFFKVGFPLTIIYMLVTVFILYYYYLS